ncbi:hypothetical protein [Pararhizobium sp.]
MIEDSVSASSLFIPSHLHIRSAGHDDDIGKNPAADANGGFTE